MNENEIPFQRITLTPLNLNNQSILTDLDDNICDSSIKKKLLEHMQNLHIAYSFNYPTEDKEFYIVPFNINKREKILKDYNLKTPEFAFLWLPSVALKASEIIKNFEGRVPAIAACDTSFSLLRPNHLLVVDLSMGYPIMGLNENNYNYEVCILAERIEEK